MTSVKFNRFYAFLLAGVAVVTVTANEAAAQTPNPAEMISRADANGDGDISWDEVVDVRNETFDRLDRNSDDIVNLDDRPKGPMAARFDEGLARLQADFDPDRDGTITREEMLNAPAPMFDKGDTNEDGVLSAEEMEALRAAAPQP